MDLIHDYYAYNITIMPRITEAINEDLIIIKNSDYYLIRTRKYEIIRKKKWEINFFFFEGLYFSKNL